MAQTDIVLRTSLYLVPDLLYIMLTVLSYTKAIRLDMTFWFEFRCTLASSPKASTSPEGHAEACTRYDRWHATGACAHESTLPRVHAAKPAQHQTASAPSRRRSRTPQLDPGKTGRHYLQQGEAGSGTTLQTGVVSGSLAWRTASLAARGADRVASPPPGLKHAPSTTGRLLIAGKGGWDEMG